MYMKKTILLLLFAVGIGDMVYAQSAADNAGAGIYAVLLPEKGGRQYIISPIASHIVEEMRAVLAKDTLIRRMTNGSGDTLIIDSSDRKAVDKALKDMAAFVWDDTTLKRFGIAYTGIVNRQAGDTLRNKWSTSVYELTPPVFISNNTIGLIYMVSSQPGSNWGGRLIALRKLRGEWACWWTLCMWDS